MDFSNGFSTTGQTPVASQTNGAGGFLGNLVNSAFNAFSLRQERKFAQSQLGLQQQQNAGSFQANQTASQPIVTIAKGNTLQTVAIGAGVLTAAVSLIQLLRK